MSRKANLLLVAATAALGITLTAGAKPVAEALINDYTIKAVNIAQVDDSGKCVAIVTLAVGTGPDVVRAVADASGDVRVYGDFGATQGLVSRANMNATCIVTFKRKLKESVEVNPLSALKSKYKAFKAEKMLADKNKLIAANNITAAVAVGYDTAVGTLEAETYVDLLNKQATVVEWYDFAAARTAALAASLTAAGIDPATVV